jgi:hypothetical protein
MVKLKDFLSGKGSFRASAACGKSLAFFAIHFNIDLQVCLKHGDKEVIRSIEETARESLRTQTIWGISIR